LTEYLGALAPQSAPRTDSFVGTTNSVTINFMEGAGNWYQSWPPDASKGEIPPPFREIWGESFGSERCSHIICAYDLIIPSARGWTHYPVGTPLTVEKWQEPSTVRSYWPSRCGQVFLFWGQRGVPIVLGTVWSSQKDGLEDIGHNMIYIWWFDITWSVAGGCRFGPRVSHSKLGRFTWTTVWAALCRTEARWLTRLLPQGKPWSSGRSQGKHETYGFVWK
jgi:hypothetical protein